MAFTNGQFGIRDNAGGAIIGGVFTGGATGLDPAAGNLIAGFSTAIFLHGLSTTVVEGNTIGNAAVGNSVGIAVESAGQVIGAVNVLNPDGTILARNGNVISGNNSAIGVGLTGLPTDERIFGNLVGTDHSGCSGSATASGSPAAARATSSARSAPPTPPTPAPATSSRGTCSRGSRSSGGTRSSRGITSGPT